MDKYEIESLIEILNSHKNSFIINACDQNT